MLRVREGNSKAETLVSVLRIADAFITITLSGNTKADCSLFVQSAHQRALVPHK